MEMTASMWIWPACLGAAGAALSAWLTRPRSLRPTLTSLDEGTWRFFVRRLGRVALAVATASATAAATARMIASTAAPGVWLGAPAIPAALAFFWIGFVTAGWMAAERDKLVLHEAVCRAATAPAAHPDTVQALAHASPDAVYEAVKALVPRRVVH